MKDTDLANSSIVAFDFDGTLTWRDSVMTFLQWKIGRPRFYARMASRPELLMRMIAAKSRGESKLGIINYILGETSEADFHLAANAFFEVQKTRIFRPDALRAWERHGQAGDKRVIVTGAMEILVAPFARYLGADRVIGTQIGFDTERRCLIALSPNCIRGEKTRRLIEIYGPDLNLVAAYGDTRGDHEMLALAQVGHYRVFTQKP